ncbi:MAG: DUF2279 domain-containing protein [Chitinophagaceae bacterium]
MKPAFVQISSFLATHADHKCRHHDRSIGDTCNAYRCSAFSTPGFLPTITGKKKLLVLLFFTSFSLSVLAQTDTSDYSNMADNISKNLADPPRSFSAKPYYTLSAQQKKQRQLVVGGINVAAYGGSLFILHRAWYKDEAKTSFQVFNDSKEWLQVDKVGHAWTAYTTGRASAMLWEWAGLPHKKAVWIGGLSGFVYLTGIEFLDAHSAKWGWSWGDIATNVVGSGLFMGQEFLWREQRIQFKFSFHRKNYGEPMLEKRADELYGEGLYERMLKDYNAQAYWFSFNLKSFFPESSLPPWLNIAAGYGADGMFGGFQNKWNDETGNEITRYDIPRKRQFYLAPDIDLTKIKTKSKFLKTSFTLLNAFKFPAPSLMIDSKGKMKAYLFYF